MLAAAPSNASAVGTQMEPDRFARRARKCVLGFPVMKRRHRATQLLSETLNTRRDKCDAGEKKENKRGGAEKKKKSHVAILSDLQLLACVRSSALLHEVSAAHVSLTMSLMIRPLAPRVSLLRC